MGRYDNENVIISEARSVPAEKTCFLTKSPFERQLYRAVIKEWPKWTINNGHDNIPPDYFSCDHKLMFDVMRINDSESVITTKRGKDLLYNPVKSKERSMLHEVQSFAKELSLNISIDNIFVNGEPDGNYDAIHRYKFYHEQAQRVFLSHIESIPLCRSLHPNYKMGFFVVDETESYIEHANPVDAWKPFDAQKPYLVSAIPHIPFQDVRFVEPLMTGDIDFIIWYMPYKLLRECFTPLPMLTFIDWSNRDKILPIEYSDILLRRM